MADGLGSSGSCSWRVAGVIVGRDGARTKIDVVATAPDHLAAFEVVKEPFDFKEADLEAWRVKR